MQLKPLTAIHIKDIPWEQTRFDDIYIKLFSFRDGVVFEIQRFEPDTGTFPHQHDFRQLRYILEGEFIVNGVSHGPGTFIDFPERQPYEVRVPSGGQWIIVQLAGSTTGIAPTDPSGVAYGKAPTYKPSRLKP
jgi:hypothetical protein